MKFKSDIEVQAGLKDSSGAAGTSGQVLSSTASGVSWVSQSGFVPYTGATGDVNLGIHQLKADSLAVSTTSTETVDVGEIVWNAIDGTFDMGLIGGVTLQAGQELHMYGKATEVISNGQAVMFAGVQGDHILVAKADAATINANPEYFIGVATQNFAINDFGYVTVFGNVRELDTTSYTLGSVLYYNSESATDGLLTATMPTAPNAKIEVAAVVRVHATQGILLVRPHVMPKLKDLQDVHAPNPVNGNVLFWNSQLFRNEFGSISNILGYTPANDSQVVKLTGNQSIAGVKTFTSGTTVWNSESTNSLDFQSSGVTVASLIFNSSFTQFNSNASGGYIFKNSSANNSLSISDTGDGVFLGSLTSTSFVKTGGTSSQFLKADGSVDSSTYVPTSRTITINGVTQDLSSNATFTIAAGVTSVNGLTGSVTLTTSNISEGTNLYYTDARVNANSNVSANTAARHAAVTLGTANGLSLSTQQLSLGLASSSANGALSSTDWTTFNSKQNALSGNGFVRLSGSTVSYITGNPDQYIKADGSLSTAMNSRIEVNFVATAGQTTFTTPYEVGQVDVYYNGSKLYPSEFTATNGTTVVLAQAATLNAQISIVKYVAALSTSAIRNETTFTTTAGQTTFSVNYTVGQLDVFYNGSKLNVSEFTATNGTSVVLGFACAAGESVVFVSYVNQVSGASGTANRVAKFTGPASLGNSQIFDDGTSVGIGSSSLELKMNIVGDGGAFPATGGTSQMGALRLEQDGSNLCADFGSNGASGAWLQVTNKTNLALVFPFLLNPNGGNVLIGKTTDNGAKLQVNGTVSASGRLSLGDGIVSNFNAISISSGVYTNTSAISIGASNPTGGVVSPIITFSAPNASYSYAVRGGMYYNGSNLQMEFRTTSDYRVKEDLIEDFNATDLLDKIKIYDHKWIGASGRSYSVIAHELQNVIPYLVSGQKDAILDDGSMDLQTVDYSKLVPILIKSIQELKAEIEILKNK